MNKLLIFGIILIGVGGGLLFLQKDTDPEQKPLEIKSAIELSNEDYLKVKQSYLSVMDEETPQDALNKLRETIKTDDSLMRSCHSVSHDIGRAAFIKYKDFAGSVKFQDEICNSGYLHGVIEEYFSSVPDVFVAMQTVCNQYPSEKFLSWECYHGVGHGLMYYTNNDLNKSLEFCGKYQSAFAQSTCTNGVFMENFNTDQKLHPSKYLDKQNPFYPCAEQQIKHKGDCYLYAPTYYLNLHLNDYTSALEWCEGAETEFISNCGQGVGNQIMKENINSPIVAESACATHEPLERDCIGGITGQYITHFGSLEPAQELCTEFKSQNKIICEQSISSASVLFK